jgi:hypothetical protein
MPSEKTGKSPYFFLFSLVSLAQFIEVVMSTEPSQYLFHVHKALPRRWLGVKKDLGFPGAAKPEEWQFTSACSAEDTNPKVREMIAADGYCLFKIGGCFEDIEYDRAHKPCPPRPTQFHTIGHNHN